MSETSAEELQIGALLHFYFKIDPDTLDEETFWKYWYRLEFALKKTNQIGN